MIVFRNIIEYIWFDVWKNEFKNIWENDYDQSSEPHAGLVFIIAFFSHLRSSTLCCFCCCMNVFFSSIVRRNHMYTYIPNMYLNTQKKSTLPSKNIFLFMARTHTYSVFIKLYTMYCVWWYIKYTKERS